MPSLHELAAEELPPAYGQRQSSGPGIQNDVKGPEPAGALPHTRLKKPVAIPATSPRFDSLFIRAYPPALEEFTISRETFLQFLDDLSKGAVIRLPSRVPVSTSDSATISHAERESQTAGQPPNAVARSTKHKKSKSQARKRIRKANKHLFNPRGLHAEIAKLDTLARISNIPILNPQGKIDKTSPLLSDIPNQNPTISVTRQQSQLQSFSPWIATLDLPSPTPTSPQSDPFAKGPSAQSEKDLRKASKSEIRSQKEINKLASNYDRKLSKLDDKMVKASKEGDNPERSDGKLAKIERKKEKAGRKYEEKLAEITNEKESSKTKDDHKRENLKKPKMKGLWLVIRNLDDDIADGNSGRSNIGTENGSGRGTGIYHNPDQHSMNVDSKIHGAGEIEDEESTDDDSDEDLILTPETSENEEDSEESGYSGDEKHR